MIILYIKCIIGALAGLGLHTLSKFNSQQEIHSAGNVGELTFMKFLGLKPVSHIINFVCVVIWFLFLPDVMRAHPTVYGSEFYANIVHIFSCLLIGWANSSIILKALGVGQSKALKVIDEKTNILDGK